MPRTDVKIFIACSKELNKEREQIKADIQRLNKKFDWLHLEPVEFSDNETGSYKGYDNIQDSINPLIDEAQIVILLFYSQLGEFTKEEYDLALNKNKKIFLYFKNGFSTQVSDENSKYGELLKFKDEVEQKNKVQFVYFEGNELSRKLIDDDFYKYLIKTFPEKSGELIDTDTNDVSESILLLRHKVKSLNYTSSEDQLKELRDLWEKVMPGFDFQEKIKNTPPLIDKSISTLFDLILSQEKLSKSNIQEITNTRISDEYKWYHRSLLVSALTLSFLNSKNVDQQKILLLIDFIDSKEEKVWQKALTGLALALIYKKNSWQKFERVKAGIAKYKTDSSIQNSLKIIALILNNSLYKFIDNPNVYVNSNFLMKNYSNCFMPFYEDNETALEYIRNSHRDEPGRFIEVLNLLPIPDFIKYNVCLSDEENNKNISPQKIIKTLLDLIAAARYVPFINLISELYLFIKYHHADRNEKIFTDKLSLGSVELKDHILNEVEKNLIVGFNAIRLHDWNLAINYFIIVLNIDKNNSDALLNIANCYGQINKKDDELNSRLRFEKIQPANESNLISIAKIFFKKDMTKALEYFDKAHELFPKSTDALHARALLRLENDYLFDALNDCNTILSINENIPQIYLLRGRIYLNLFENELALKDINHYISSQKTDIEGHTFRILTLLNFSDPGTIAKEIESTIDFFHRDYKIIIVKVAFLFQTFQWHEAIEYLDQNLAAFDSKEKKYIFHKLKAEYFNLLDDDYALKECNSAIHLYSNIDVRYIKSDILKKIGENHKADTELDLIEKMLGEHPSNEDLANLFLKKGKYDDAIAEVTKAIENNVANFKLYIFRASVHEKMHNVESAIDDYIYALKLVPNNSTICHSLGSLYSDIDNPEKALDYFNKAIELSPFSELYHVKRGLFYMNHKKYDRAALDFGYLKHLLKLKPAILLVTVFAYFHNNDLVAMEKILENDEDILKDYDSYYCLRLLLYCRKSDKINFYETLKKAKTRNMDLWDDISEITLDIEKIDEYMNEMLDEIDKLYV